VGTDQWKAVPNHEKKGKREQGFSRDGSHKTKEVQGVIFSAFKEKEKQKT